VETSQPKGKIRQSLFLKRNKIGWDALADESLLILLEPEGVV
jgi:hypothetical protein